MSVTSSGQTHKDSNLNQLGVTKAPPESWYYPALKLAESRRFRDLGWKNRAEPPLSAVSVLTNELANRALAFFFFFFLLSLEKCGTAKLHQLPVSCRLSQQPQTAICLT